jgi:DNA primase
MSLAKPDIVLTIENEGIELRRRGRDFWAPCPLHQEKTPSFKVSVDRQAFHCFGCGAGGDVIAFIMLYRKLSFKDALAYLRLDADARPDDPVKKRKQRLIQTFRKWEQSYYRELCERRLLCVRLTRDLATMDRAEEQAALFHALPVIEYQLDILWDGSDEEKFELWKSIAGKEHERRS